MPEAGLDASSLIRKAQAGDLRALDLFFSRELPPLLRWAREHVPSWLHRWADPDDIVQLAAIRTLRRLHHLDAARAHHIHLYLRAAVRNLVTDEVRRAGRAPGFDALDEAVSFVRHGAFDLLLGRAVMKSYREALRRLTPGQRACVVGRLERGWSYDRLAKELKRPTPGAARVAVGRALEALAREMDVRIPRQRRRRGP